MKRRFDRGRGGTRILPDVIMNSFYADPYSNSNLLLTHQNLFAPRHEMKSWARNVRRIKKKPKIFRSVSSSGPHK